MAKVPAVFTALADPTRRAILESLREGGRTAGMIAAQFNVSWPAISRHLRLLRTAGLVWETREGRTRYYEINQQALASALTWLGQFRPDPVRSLPVSPISSAGREYIS
jgi:DNA-binding transcriptional ArsR family regulator